MGARHGTPEERFRRYVGRDGECWMWQGCVNHKGYGVLNIGHRNVLAHRFCYELHFGPIPDGLLVLHRCDRPGCCRPEHLMVGTAQDNSTDMVRKGRASQGDPDQLRAWQRAHPRQRLPGERYPGAKLTDESVAEIRRVYAAREATLKELGRRFGVSGGTIWTIVRNRGWNHLPSPGGLRDRGNSPLTADQVRAIRSRYAAGGVTQVALAAEFGVTQTCVSNIIVRRTWTDLA